MVKNPRYTVSQRHVMLGSETWRILDQGVWIATCVDQRVAERIVAALEMYISRCICEPGDPCDYHAATCTTCDISCKGHPLIG